MTFWLDAQLSPALVLFLSKQFSVSAIPLRDLNLRDAEDEEIFFKAREVKAVVMTKDSDFITLLEKNGPPPQIVWLTCGNTSNEQLKKLFSSCFKKAIQLLKSGEALVEIGEP